MNKRPIYDISIAIPAYSRSRELDELLQSIHVQSVLPAEVTICEDLSPEREAIGSVVRSWKERFEAEGCVLNYQENEQNLGYDRNVKRVIEASHSTWVMLMGNDDLLLPDCIAQVKSYLEVHAGVSMISRSFLMFKGDLDHSMGFSRISPKDCVFTPQNSNAGIIMRALGFVGGLIVLRDWAVGVATDRYDGSLYYQIYLGAVAYCQHGIGYISSVIVGSRTGNPPLFGSASSESDVHVPGSYTPKGRSKMWAGILRIVDDVGSHYGISLLPDMKEEIGTRQSFHIFEMMAGANPRLMHELRSELQALGLFSHPLPRVLYRINVVSGKLAPYFYRIVRSLRNFIYGLRNEFETRIIKTR